MPNEFSHQCDTFAHKGAPPLTSHRAQPLTSFITHAFKTTTGRFHRCGGTRRRQAPFYLEKTHTSDPAKACPDAATIQPKLTVHAALTKANTVTGDLFEHIGTAPITSPRAWPLTSQ